MRPISEQSHTGYKESLVDQMSEKIRDTGRSYNAVDTGKIVRISINARNHDPLQWLSAQKIYPSVYWSDRLNQFETAGVGVTVSSNNIYDLKINNFQNNVRFFGGFRFDKSLVKGSPWYRMNRAIFVLPRFELTRTNAGNEFVCNLNFPDDLDKINEIEDQLNGLQFDNKENDITIPELLNRTDKPDKEEWKLNIQKILDLIAAGKIEKLVSARESTLEFSANLDPVFILRNLKKSTPGCFHFCFQPETDYAFIGASPERLYYRKKNQIISEALAGTRARGNTADDDYRLGNELLNSEKDIREQSYVSKSIMKNLDQLCCKLSVDKETILMKLTRVQHLMTGIEGKLIEGATDQVILGSLHPTPAVGGYPQEKAFDLISEIEPFDRGWYTGLVGWISKDEADFAVAIRSGLIVKNKLHLYAGAGIVKGSDPDNEWNEIESKIATFMKILS